MGGGGGGGGILYIFGWGSAAGTLKAFPFGMHRDVTTTQPSKDSLTGSPRMGCTGQFSRNLSLLHGIHSMV